MARIFGAAQAPELTWHIAGSPSGALFWTLQDVLIVFSVSSGSSPANQIMPGLAPAVTLSTALTAGGNHFFDPTRGVWLALAIAGTTTWQLALEADFPNLDGIIGPQYAIIRRIFKYGSVPFQQG